MKKPIRAGTHHVDQKTGRFVPNSSSPKRKSKKTVFVYEELAQAYRDGYARCIEVTEQIFQQALCAVLDKQEALELAVEIIDALVEQKPVSRKKIEKVRAALTSIPPIKNK